MITETAIREALNTIIDPCSVAAGCVAGLDDMGLIRRVSLTEAEAGTHVEVVIGVTEYGCLMGAPFASEAYKRLETLSGVASVEVKLDDAFDWVPERMSEEYRARLQTIRSKRREHTGCGAAAK
ncbi:MAG TPA: iron-sulfur cluster assembly protein [Stellaceae bacterium]|nr:iron-sulfur cluster assembly protein [Stellaceae bacterium]